MLALGRIAMLFAIAAAGTAGCDAGKTKLIGSDSPAASCDEAPAAPPAGVDPFYDKYLDARGLPVLSTADVSDTALRTACVIVANMLSLRQDLRDAMVRLDMRVVVMGRNQVTTDIPEYANLYKTNPGPDWDTFRGIGATLGTPVTSAGEETVMCDQGGPYGGVNVLVHMLGTSVYLGVADVDPTFEDRLQGADTAARAAGLWENTYVRGSDPRQNLIEYYAEGVEDWFETGPESSPPDGTFNEINTRAELMAYDPMLYAIVAGTMRNDAWRPTCPATP